MEHTGPAFVLDTFPISEFDSEIIFFSRDLGKINARVTSMRKSASKLAPHLQIGNKATVRLVHKNTTRVADALQLAHKTQSQSKHMNVISLLSALLANEQIDPLVWEDLNSEKVSITKILSYLGFNQKHANCQGCKTKAVDYFSSIDLTYYCAHCTLNHKNAQGLYQLF
ncbi:MAG: recombination protein O N-terminal domain-containing protein [Zetaproteobacteria bacterium]|nr:recombination protein O N-terminal domain-containing protein [Zetaproteobacteria bacterium]